jgi:hypothetical protein
MPITRNNSGALSNRAAFNGKGLTFVEIVFGQSIAASATTPDAQDSKFQEVAERLSSANNGGTILAQNYFTARAATAGDAADASAITAGNSVDVYQFILEGLAINIAPNTAGATTQAAVAAAITEAEADILTEVKTIFSDDSTNDIGVKVRVLLPEGSASGDSQAVIGMFDPRGAA